MAQTSTTILAGVKVNANLELPKILKSFDAHFINFLKGHFSVKHLALGLTC
jgi:hypothetical protein